MNRKEAITTLRVTIARLVEQALLLGATCTEIHEAVGIGIDEGARRVQAKAKKRAFTIVRGGAA